MMAFHNSKYEVTGREHGLWRLSSVKTADEIFVRACKYIGKMGMTFILDENGFVDPTYRTQREYPKDSLEFVDELMNSISQP